MVKLEILSPIAQVRITKSRLAPRLGRLDGKRGGLYWNGKAGGDVALAHMRQILEKRADIAEFGLIRSALPGPKEKVEEAKTYDAVIGAAGD